MTSSSYPRGVEILCHNLSHSDMILSLNTIDMTCPNGSIFARPSFNSYREITGKIVYSQFANETMLSEIPAYYYPTYAREKIGSQGQYPISNQPSSEKIPFGFDLVSTPVVVDNLSSLRFRGNDETLLKSHIMTTNIDNIDDDNKTPCVIEGCMFPLVAVLIPKWLMNVDSSKRKVFFIISGRGTPNDSNSRMIDNSTKFSGILIKNFIQMQYPDIEVILVHSNTNIFRYDENIAFVKRELLPLIDAIRDDLANKLAAKWKDHFKLTLSFAHGSSARISSINAALKPYR